ncbi:hypothetical protein [Tritonibacter mobilis]|uniref:hypothetical protein n=1 Tax=Tritonibacter mobilis TaxID=379347 RepID=UPI0014034717|nr:hypothetical protein [Tritonibacter mobilis]NHM25301.1 hypothetical protein [Tritonibacter mobilis]
MADMARGVAEQRVYVSSLDPGMGKTTSLIVFLRQLVGPQDHRDVAVLVCLSRKAEVERIVRDVGLEEVDFAVLTSDEEINALSSTPPSEARVLFTTQQMLLSRLRGGRFETCPTFHYQGLPREVRVWDEAMEPGQVVMLSSDDIGGLLRFLRRVSADLADTMDGLMDRLRKADIGSLFQFPKLDHEVLQRAVALLGNDWQAAHVEALAELSGQRVRVCSGWGSQRVAVLARTLLPEDLAPVLVLDASARVRETYKLWAKTRGGLTFLPSATKDYSPLTIHVARKGAGKSSWGQNGPALAKTVAEMRSQRLGQRCLIVHHKADKHLDASNLISDAIIPDALHNTSFLHWGMHQATNEYADVPVVILAGTFNLPPSQYLGLAHASLGLPMDKTLPEAVVQRVALGEHGHAIVQAVGRGVTRGCSDGKCLSGEVYIIASAGSGIEEALSDWFPGATVKRWYPADRPVLTGKVAEAAAYIKQRLKEDPTASILFQDVMGHIGCSNRSNFNRTIRRHDLFRLWLADQGLVEVKLPGIRGKANAFQVELPLFAAAGVELPQDLQGSKI